MEALFNFDHNCADTDFPLYLGLEFGLKTLPGLLFCILGTVRLMSIQHMAKSTVRYTKMFKSKIVICLVMSGVCFLYMMLVFVTPKHLNISSWINKCDKEPFALFYIVQVVAWAYAAYVIWQEYERLLSEAWYAC